MKAVLGWFKKNQSIFIGLFSTIVFIFLLIILFNLVIMPVYTKSGREVILPDVTQHSFEQADSIFKSKGFRLVIENRIYEATYPVNTVISQNPPAYSTVKTGRRIYVTLSAGERQVSVPYVIGISKRDAQFRMRQAGLDVNSRYEYDSYRPKDVVADQSVPSGQDVPENTLITLIVSNGVKPEVFYVPDVVGMSLNAAIESIEQSGMKTGFVSYEGNSDLLPDTVIEQKLEPGTEVKYNTQLDLVVSKLKSSL